MLETAVINEGWGTATDWEALAEKAVIATLAATPFAALASLPATVEIAIRLTSDAEVHKLNAAYRGKDKPTNVLSFPMVQPDLIEGLANTDDGEVLLGDIVLAKGVCGAEAEEKHIPVADHATHLIVHGLLHLLGYDHIRDEEAERMESIERAVLAGLGLHNPYNDWPNNDWPNNDWPPK